MSSPGWKRSVPLPASIRLVWHETEPYPREVPEASLYASLEFPVPPGPLPYLVANMVTTQNGEATIDGKAATIGTRVDGVALTRLRAATDAIMTGSGTVVAEDVTAALPEAEAARRVTGGRPPRLLIAMLASQVGWSEEVFARRFFTDPRWERIVFTGERAREEDIHRLAARGVEVVRVSSGHDGRPDVTAALRVLWTRGIRCAVTEGGPRLLASLLRARVVNEYFLTTSPLVTGDSRAPRPVAGSISDRGEPLLLARISRHEFEFQDPRTGARLVEAYDRFRVIYAS